MNFLAHIYLSGQDEELMIGNFIADFIRGNDFKMFPKRVKKGIRLHRMIDTYTDQHPIFRESKKRLRPKYDKVSGIIVDIYYDHFLAVNWYRYSDVPLPEYAHNFYQLLLNNKAMLPEKVQHFLPFMISNNWLVNYANFKGVARTFDGMSKRASFISDVKHADQDLKKDYDKYHAEFRLFFRDLRRFVENQTIKLL